MENQKMNPWMLSTFVLVGVMVGLGISQIPSLKIFGDTGKTATIQPDKPADPISPETRVLTSDQSAKLAGTSPARGEITAPITMVEFSDFQCPYCSRFVTATMPQIEENYIKTGKVKLVFRNFPLEGHPLAPTAALAGACANEQGKFWEMHDALFDGQVDWSGNEKAQSIMQGYAKEIGLDMTKFNSCVTTKKYADAIKQDLVDGISVGVTGTPGFFINGKEVSGAMPYDLVFKPILDAELAGKKWDIQFGPRGEVTGVKVQ